MKVDKLKKGGATNYHKKGQQSKTAKEKRCANVVLKGLRKSRKYWGDSYSLNKKKSPWISIICGEPCRS